MFQLAIAPLRLTVVRTYLELSHPR